MRIRSVRTYNINSLKGENFIDFQSGILGDTGLFAIIGPTGAGKSTILDAITLALYNQTPRSGKMSKSAITDFGAIITRSTDEARSEVEYEINGAVYRSLWRISRARTGNLRDYEMELSQKDAEGEFQILDLKKSGIPDKNSEIICLSFDQFVKSILLSQGDFARFLKANANERGELLEKITGTEIYRQIGRAAFAKRGEELKILENLQRKLEGVELLSAEERRDKKAELKELNESITVVEKQYKTLQNAILQKTNLKKLGVELESLTKRSANNFRESTQFEERKRQLALHLKVLPLKGDLEHCTFQEKNLALMQVDKKHYQQVIPNLTQTLVDDKLDLNSRLKDKDALGQELEKEQLVWTVVRAKDQELTQQKTKVEASETSVKRTQLEQTRTNKELDTLAGREEILRKKKEETLRSADKLEPFSNLPEQFPALLAEHKQFQIVCDELGGELNAYPNSKTHVELSEMVLATEQQKSVGEALSKAQQFIDATQLAIGNLSQEEVQLALDKGKEHIGSLEQLNELTTQCRDSKTLHDNLSKEKTTFDKSIATAKAQLVDTNKKLELERALLKELRARWDRQKLEASYEEARSLLTKGDPCPLCGSAEHPYVESYESVLNKTQIQLADSEKRELHLTEESKKLELGITASKTSCKNVVDRQKEILKQLEQWQTKSSLLAKSVQIDTVDHTTVEQRRIQVQEQNNVNAKRIQKFTILSKAKEKLPLLQRLEMFVNRVVLEEEKLGLLLSTYPTDAESPISSRMNILKEKKQEVDALKKRKELEDKESVEIGLIQKEKTQRREEIQAQLLKLEEENKLQNKTFTTLQDDRKSLFGVKLVDDEEKLLRASLQKIEKQYGELENAYSKKQVQLVEWTKTSADIDTKIQALDRDIKVATEELSQKLVHLGIEDRTSAQKALISEDEATKWQQRIRVLEEESLQIKQSITDTQKRRDEIQEMDLPESSIADLEKEFDSQTKQLNESQQRMGALKNQIAHDKKNREASKVFVEQIDKQQLELNRWSELSSLIGDATGNRFSKFAQELTLEQLLVLANKHLQPLSDRYLLKSCKIGKENELFVVDLYHGNEKRSVKTLSGGESFLVSLSLALGLSDLAGQNTRIESLFIDEGFGTLDQETLDTALSTLERLQHETNRTIGVISHVQALKERITTQIELKRDSSGFSTLEVVG